MTSPDAILTQIYTTAGQAASSPLDPAIQANVETICRNVQNRAAVRLVMACLLAKLSDPAVDVRKPYTEIGDADAFSGRTYDERYITGFINRHDLPCNPTTAFLTPALRNRNATLTPQTNLVGRPRAVYVAMLQLLDDVWAGRVSAERLLTQVVRELLQVRDERRQRMQSMLAELKQLQPDKPLSSEEIVNLMEQHLASKAASRLPVLVVAAIYATLTNAIGERTLPLESHTAADVQTGALGDVLVVAADRNRVLTAYEIKTRKITVDDIDAALVKINRHQMPIDNYIFVTTESISDEVNRKANSIYIQAGVEMVVLDCIAFLRHFLHLFHRERVTFLENYQNLLLDEPESAVRQPLKEAFLVLRHAAESGD